MMAAPKTKAGKSHQAGTTFSGLCGELSRRGAAGEFAPEVGAALGDSAFTVICSVSLGPTAIWNALKKSSAIFLATLSISLEPTCANLPPI